MAQEIAQGDIFGRIGKQFGEGVAEQIPRNQLSKQLSGIQGLPPQVAQAARIPGGLQALQPYLPYLQSQAAAQSNLPQETLQTSSQQELIPATKETKNKTQTQPVRRLSQDPEVWTKIGNQEYLKNPARFGGDVNSAIAQQEKNAKAQQNQITNTESKLLTNIQTGLQTAGLPATQEITGELQNLFQKKAEDAVINREMTEDEAARKFGTEALDFAKARNSLSSGGPEFWSAVFGKGKENIKAARLAYEKTGLPELFVNDLISQKDFSVPVASYIALPPQGETKKAIENVPMQPWNIRADAKYGKGKVDDKVYKQVFDTIGNNDSLQSVSFALKKKGYNADGFLDYALNHSEKLDPRQTRELQRRSTFPGTLTDLLYESLTE